MVKNFVVKSTLINTIITAKSLIELLIALIIFTILFTAFWSYNFFDSKAHDKDFLSLTKLQSALYLARSEAIKLKTKVYLCPSRTGRKECCYSWTSGIMIFVKDQENIKILNYLSLSFKDPILRFQFFGNQKEQKITFLPNGLTINNGHFCVSNILPCLYINQAGRVYIK